MNSFISWIGGKKFLRKKIISQFPESYGRYIEVFGGAGWVMFGIEQPAPLEVLDCRIDELFEYIPNEVKCTGKYLIKDPHGNRKKP